MDKEVVLYLRKILHDCLTLVALPAPQRNRPCLEKVAGRFDLRARN